MSFSGVIMRMILCAVSFPSFFSDRAEDVRPYLAASRAEYSKKSLGLLLITELLSGLILH